jgi:hypothetical protein
MRILVIACVTLALLAGVPAAATGQSVGPDSVVGTASECVESFEPAPGQIICARRQNLEVDVASGPAGESTNGTVTLGSSGLTPGGSVFVAGDATCLKVTGQTATIGVTGTWRQGGSAGAAEYPLAGLLRVEDAGAPGSGADTVEFAYRIGEPFGPALPGPTDCSTFPGTFGRDLFWFPDFANDAGDLVVTDTPSPPPSKEECKNGGWRNFPGFKNQGDCVSFVATNGKNQPAGNKKP